MLVVNNENLQGQDSFVALGPINLIAQHSVFNPTIQLAYSGTPNFRLVKERLDKRISSKRRRRLAAKKYNELTIQTKFYSILEILKILFQAVPIESVEDSLKSIWGNVKRVELHRLLSILVATGYVSRVGDDKAYFSACRPVQSFLELGNYDEDVFSLQIIDFYEKNFPEIAGVVRGL